MTSLLAKRKKTSTTSLPAALRDELGLGENGGERAAGDERVRRGGGGAVGRKEARKADRKEKRASRGRPAQLDRGQEVRRQGQGPHHQRVIQTQQSRPGRSHILPASRIDKGKERDVMASKADKKPVGSQRQASGVTRGQRKHVGGDETTPLQRLMARNQPSGSSGSGRGLEQPSKKRRLDESLSKTEQQEEDEIAWLEAHLGAKETVVQKADKKVEAQRFPDDDDDEDGNEEEAFGLQGGEDGLDDLLDDLDRFYPGMYDEPVGNDGSRDSDEDEDEDEEDEDEEDEAEDEADEGEVGEDIEVDDEEVDNVRHAIIDEEVQEQGSERQSLAVDVGEHQQAVAAGATDPHRYIPPALRRRAENTASTDSAEMQKLRRQAKGLLNRLGEGNIESIVVEMAESLYRQHSRADVTSVLTTLIIQTVSSSSNLVETFVVLHAALVASLHRLIGLEFGAHFVQTIVENWLAQYTEAREKQGVDGNVEEVGKESKNLLVLIANLYNLGVVASPLMFDIVKLTLGMEKGKEARSMTELDVELLLKVVKTSGGQLRHDDATSLKTIVQLAKEQQTKTGAVSSRSRFMLEALEDVKNNRSKAVQAQGLEQQSIARMKKYLAGLSRKRTVRTQEPLRVGLEDLRNVDKRGKWWLVGASWAGYDFGDQGSSGDGASRPAPERKSKAGQPGPEGAKQEKLLEIARQHGMNTAVRQSIFVILISSQDYLDAVEKLQSLKFSKDSQRREVVRVLLSCIGSEGTFNPYYAVLANRLAADDIGTRFTLQYCLWDFLRDLGEKNVGGRTIIEREEDEEGSDGGEEEHAGGISEQRIANVARAYGWWLAKGALSLSAMKVIDFTGIKSRAIFFLQQLIVHLLLSTQTTSPVLTLALSKSTGARNTRDQVGDKNSQQAVEAVFAKGTLSNRTLSQGLHFFLEQHLKPKECLRVASSLGADEFTRGRLLWARGVAKQVVKAGALAAGSSGPRRAEM